jgi:hypothetical protein
MSLSTMQLRHDHNPAGWAARQPLSVGAVLPAHAAPSAPDGGLASLLSALSQLAGGGADASRANPSAAAAKPLVSAFQPVQQQCLQFQQPEQANGDFQAQLDGVSFWAQASGPLPPPGPVVNICRSSPDGPPSQVSPTRPRYRHRFLYRLKLPELAVVPLPFLRCCSCTRSP